MGQETPHASAMHSLCTGAAERDHRALTADLWPHPLTSEGRETVQVALPPGSALELALEAVLPVPPAELAHAIAVALDGERIPASAWSVTPVRGGQTVTVRVALGDGGGGSDPMTTILQIGILVASIYFPPLLALGPLAEALVGVGIALVGSLVANALVPPPRIPAAASTALQAPGQAARVYSLSGGGNRARPYQPMLLVLGRHRIHPDLAAVEYTTFRRSEQFLSQIFSFGLGDLAVENLRIGNTELGDYDEVEQEIALPGEAVTLVAGDVDTEGGAALENTDWIARETPDRTRRIAVDLTGRIFRVAGSGAYVSNAVEMTIRWRRAGAAAWVERTVRLASSRSDPVRHSEEIDVAGGGAPGVWEVEVRRDDEPSMSNRVYDDVAFSALRSYQDSAEDRGADTRLALEIRASGQLSGRLDRLSAIVGQRVPVWDAGAWSADRRVNSNPAAVFRAFALGWHDAAGRLLAGSGRAIDELDHATLGAWFEWCAGQALVCNHVLEGGPGPEEVEQLIARCGRAAPTWQSGRLGVIWEDAGRQPSTLVTPARVISGSLTSSWESGPTAEEIVVRYIDPDADWQEREVRRLAPGVITPGYTAAVSIPGVSSAENAAVHCNLQAARQVYHRRRLAWEMGRDGSSIVRGDVVYLAHDLVSGGITGRLAGGTAALPQLDRAVQLAGDSWLLVETPDGELHQSAVAVPVVRTALAEVSLADPLPASPSVVVDGSGPEDWVWRLYRSALPPLKVRIIDVKPSAADRVRIIAIDEVQEYHDAATADLTVSLVPPHTRQAQVVAIAVTETLVRAGSSFAVEIAAAITVSGDWRGGVVTAALDGGAAQRVAILSPGDTEARWITQPSGRLAITCVPGSEAAPAGRALTIFHDIEGHVGPPAPPTNFLAEVLGDGTRRFRFTPPTHPDLAGVIIRYAEDTAGPVAWEDMIELHKGVLTSSPLETTEPAPGLWIFAARSLNTGGRESDTDIRIYIAFGEQRLGDAVIWSCPSTMGWPGAIAGAERSSDGQDALEGEGDYSWDDLTTWDAWESWGAGNGADAGTTFSFTTEAVDLGADITFSLRWTGDVDGDAAFEYRGADTEADLGAAVWSVYTPAVVITDRWLQLRWRLTGDGTVLLRLDHLCWSAHAPVSERKFLDMDTANWAGSAAGGREVPVDLSVVTDVQITLQSVGAGWSWSLDNKNNPTRIKIFDGDGDPADALVDAVIRGVA